MKVATFATGMVLAGLCCSRLMAETGIAPQLLQPESTRAAAFQYDSHQHYIPNSLPADEAATTFDRRDTNDGVTETLDRPDSSSLTSTTPAVQQPAATAASSIAPTPTTPATPAAVAPAAPPIAAAPTSSENTPLATPADAQAAAEDSSPAAPAAEGFRLPQPGSLQSLGINVGGWLEQGVTFNGDRPADRFNGPVATNDRANEYQMNQFWFYFDRPTQTDGCGWDLGGHADIVYGSDWRFGSQYGLESNINSSQNFYGLILPQFYMQAAVDDLTVKMGHFATSMGNEVIPAPNNFFYSHSYLLGYTEPLLVFGLLADYKLTDQWTVLAGFHRGWMMYDDNNQSLDFLGGVKWKSLDSRTELSFMLNSGPQDAAGEHNTFDYALVLKHKLTDQFQYVIQNNYVFTNDGSVRQPGQNADSYGICQWLTYDFCPHWSGGLRAEWFRDNDGSRVAGVGNWIESGRGWQALPGFAGNFYEVSLGLNWHPHANVTLRPEVRWDWYEGTRNLANQLPFDGGNKDNQFLTAMDLIVTF
jgi:hypothetical protein